MDHEPVLISTIAVGLACRLRRRAASPSGSASRRSSATSPPGSRSARSRRASSPTPRSRSELAEIGVILLMFGVGIHFSIRDLLAVRRDRDPGRGRPDRRRDGPRDRARRRARLGHRRRASSSGWRSRSRARSSCCAPSTDRGELDTPQGRIAVGWLIVEDLFTVVVLVLLPTIAPLLGGDAAAARPTRSGAHRRASPSRSARRPSSRCSWSSAARGSSRGSWTIVATRGLARAVHARGPRHRARHRVRRRRPSSASRSPSGRSSPARSSANRT